ncbi:MAG: 4Fe-4S cluster-binding domain-containing protein [Lentisphaeria bacterium]|nr:4Fe-4S cluster-binding domain-containing protein [Lentisphaeria bacterium]
MDQTFLRIYETFSSIQGESSYAGKPCFFIRLAGCQLNCKWCDTRKARSFDSGTEMTVSQLLALANQAAIPLVEITGGEPLMQKNVIPLCQALLDAGYTVLMETNGAADCSVLPDGVIRIIDYKTPSSGEDHAMLDTNFQTVRNCDEVKFVISNRQDYECAVKVLAKFDLEKRCANVLFSPAAGIMDSAELVKWILEDHLQVRINLQFHKIIWGAEAEGV